MNIWKKAVCMLLLLILLPGWLITLPSQTWAGERLRLSSSAQVYDAYLKDVIPAFEGQTGFQVDVFISSSASSLGRLMNGMCDLATTVEGFKFRYGEYGYLEIPFCKDPLVVITHPAVPTESITDEQVRGIFSGRITNWKDLGGPNERIILVVPGDSTAAYKNFVRQAMGREEVVYDFMSYLSTVAVKAIQSVPYSISFIGQGVIAGQSGIKTLRINDRAPGDAEYPYHQVFSFAIEGNPTGLARKFVDFVFSEEGQKVIRKKNMTPILLSEY